MVCESQARREGGAEGVTARGPGDTGGPGVQNCQVYCLECKIHQLKLRPADAMIFFLLWAEIRTSAKAMTFFLLIA